MANDSETPRPRCLLVHRPKMEKDGEAHLSIYASDYNRVKINEPP